MEEINEKGVKRDYYMQLLYPNRKELTGEEKFKAVSDASFIYDHIDKIDEKFNKFIYVAKKRGESIDEHEVIEGILKGVKRDYYSELLYPNRKGLTGEEKFKAVSDASFIYDHIDKIDEKFNEFIYVAEKRGESIDEHEMIEEILKGVKRDYYSELLNPNRKGLTGEEKFKAVSDASFIYDHIDKIDEKFNEFIYVAEKRGESIDEHEMIEGILKGVKRDYYSELLHPNRKGLTGEEKFKAASDASFIYDHIDKIDEKFDEFIFVAEKKGQAIDEHEIMKKILEELKGEEEQTRDYSAEMKIAENIEENARNITNTRNAGEINETSKQILSRIEEIENSKENDDRYTQ